MRLICPNCDAEYQVDDAAIPEGGRDVQCSNCGHAWFQLPAEVEIAREAEDEIFGEETAAVRVQPVQPEESEEPEPVSVAADAGQVASGPVDAIDAVEDTAPAESDLAEPVEQVELEAPVAPVPTRQSLAESVLSVLREEAERESAVRREQAPLVAEERGAIETQTEFGLDDPSNAAGSSAAARHIARLKGTDVESTPIAEARAAARRDLLPDIEEINSTLRANSDRAQAADEEIDALPNLKPKRRGFRSGFVLMMVVAVALSMAYVMAPRIVAQIPGAAPTMKAYVAAVDSGRLWLDGVMKSASGSLRSLSGDNN